MNGYVKCTDCKYNNDTEDECWNDESIDAPLLILNGKVTGCSVGELQDGKKAEILHKVAVKLLKIKHPDIEWGHSGTIDDDSWRRCEQECIYNAQEIIDILEEIK